MRCLASESKNEENNNIVGVETVRLITAVWLIYELIMPKMPTSECMNMIFFRV